MYRFTLVFDLYYYCSTLTGDGSFSSSSEYRYEMYIGQDLLNRHFLMQPYQPVAHLTPSLALLRTKMGLTLLGSFSRATFARWTPTNAQVRKLKEVLLFSSQGSPHLESRAVELEKATRRKVKTQVNESLTFNLSKLRGCTKVRLTDFLCK